MTWRCPASKISQNDGRSSWEGACLESRKSHSGETRGHILPKLWTRIIEQYWLLWTIIKDYLLTPPFTHCALSLCHPMIHFNDANTWIHHSSHSFLYTKLFIPGIGKRRQTFLTTFWFSFTISISDPATPGFSVFVYSWPGQSWPECQGRVQKFLLNRLVDFSIKWVGGVPLVH